ncbi:hypothetical protein AWW72_13265 [Acinetobacter sp. NRRL B-65365]|uniref:hypothetical protein n=1 Tax=Acinetobacter sp. NRRL B-65365 TaxID=1785092 RepID=UPI00079FED75|nr:hypothetical protein [Acinetobacter sp. NRRL B-65365]KYQ83552.1 hypothetical protein AWW72_13265 [Acinetobacter sp. NRRL B-65365]
MIEEIMKHAPKGATHWQAGVYYKENEYGVWSIWDENEWNSSFRFPDGFMTTIPKSVGIDQGRDITNSLEDLRDCDTSPNCKKFEEQVK